MVVTGVIAQKFSESFYLDRRGGGFALVCPATQVAADLLHPVATFADICAISAHICSEVDRVWDGSANQWTADQKTLDIFAGIAYCAFMRACEDRGISTDHLV